MSYTTKLLFGLKINTSSVSTVHFNSISCSVITCIVLTCWCFMYLKEDVGGKAKCQLEFTHSTLKQSVAFIG